MLKRPSSFLPRRSFLMKPLPLTSSQRLGPRGTIRMRALLWHCLRIGPQLQGDLILLTCTYNLVPSCTVCGRTSVLQMTSSRLH